MTGLFVACRIGTPSEASKCLNLMRYMYKGMGFFTRRTYSARPLPTLSNRARLRFTSAYPATQSRRPADAHGFVSAFKAATNARRLCQNELTQPPLVYLGNLLSTDSSDTGKYFTFDGFEKSTTTGRNVTYLVSQTEFVDAGNRVTTADE